MPTINNLPINTKTFEELDVIVDSQAADADGLMFFDESDGVMKRITRGELFKNKVTPIDSIADFPDLDTDSYSARQQFNLGSFSPEGESGGGILLWEPALPKSLHDGVNYFSPTVPIPADFNNPADVQNYLDGVGEEWPASNGIFVLNYFVSREDFENIEARVLESESDIILLDRRATNTVATLAALSLPIGSKVSTKGCITLGDGGHGDFIVEAASGTPDGYSRVLLANGNHAVLQPVNGAVNPKQFGAVDSGIVNSTDAMRRFHTYCNAHDMKANYAGLSAVGIDADAQIDVHTSVDFSGVLLYPLNGTVPVPNFVTLDMFIVSDPATPLVTITGTVVASDLKSGSKYPTRGVYDGEGYAYLESAYLIPNRNGNGTAKYTQAFKINRFTSEASQPLSADISAFTSVSLLTRDQSSRSLVIENLNIADGTWNNQRILDIQRNNVRVRNITLNWNFETGARDAVHSIIRIYHSCDVIVEDYITAGVPFDGVDGGGYILEIFGGAEIITRNLQALTGWGCTGTNHVNGWYITDSCVNRIDAHGGGHNVFVENCTLHTTGVTYGWGGGIISVRNCRVVSGYAIKTRGDYGATFFGELIVSDVEVAYSNSNEIYLVDLYTAEDGIGASIDTFAPKKIIINNINRTHSASSATNQFTPVAIKVKPAVTGKVFAPQVISIDGVNSISAWKFGLLIDWANMEKSAFNSVVNLNNIFGDAACTGAGDGIRDLANAKPITSAIELIFRITNSSYIYITSRVRVTECAIVGGKVQGIDLNGISTGSWISVNNAEIRNSLGTATTTFVQFGGIRVGNSYHTVLKDCEVFSDYFDFSQVSALSGCTFRVGTINPTLPAGCTYTTALTGFVVASHFKS